MDYEDNLEAPVWDELNHEGDKTQSLVSNSIESIGQISTNEEERQWAFRDHSFICGQDRLG